MKKSLTLIFCATLITALASAAVDIAPFGVSADMQFRSAYQSRMRVSEDRPVAVMDVRVYADVGPAGKIGLMNWSRSSFTDRKSDVHRRAFSEVDYGVYWRYDLEVADDFTLSSELMHWWITQPQNIEPHCGKSNRSTYEFWYELAFRNPYVTPSLFIRRGWINASWVYFRYGAYKPFKVHDFGDAASPKPLVLSPGFFVETADNGVFESRFGKKESGRYHTGIGSCIAQVSLKWKASDNLTLHALVQQFGLVSSDARERVHGNNHRDYTMFRIGMNLSF